MATGHIEWSHQLTGEDVFNAVCAGRPGCGPDFDFGSSAILTRAADGRELLLAGQKSGVVWASRSTKKGEVVWQTRVGVGGTNGGVQWGMATDGQRGVRDDIGCEAFAADQYCGSAPLHSRSENGRRADGAARCGWETGVECEGDVLSGRRAIGLQPSQPGAVTEIPGVLFATSTDGHIRAHSVEDGKVLLGVQTPCAISRP